MSTEIYKFTDAYFNKTKGIIKKHGDMPVTYAVFMRRPVVSAPKLAVEFINKVVDERNIEVSIDMQFEEGSWVGAGEPIMYITGSFYNLVDLETLWLQRLGAACVAAYNAANMCIDLPNVNFLAFDARHCAGPDMAEMMAYAASVGTVCAQKDVPNAAGFVGNANDATAHYFNQPQGFGTMPHALIGYAGTTVAAAEMFHETYPDEPLTVLVDYFGCEISDSLEVCRRYPDLADNGKLSVRLDTPSGRYLEGMNTASSYDILEKYAPHSIRGYRTESELRHLVGGGVSAAAIWRMRESLDDGGFSNVSIVASSGFGPEKCKVMAIADAPMNAIGTGSFLPGNWQETYATADIIEYDGIEQVKIGREFLFRSNK